MIDNGICAVRGALCSVLAAKAQTEIIAHKTLMEQREHSQIIILLWGVTYVMYT